MWKTLVALAVVGTVALLLAGLRTTNDRPRILRWFGLGLIAVFTFVGAVWIAAETFSEPGGWQAAGLVALWLVPLVALSVVAWYWVAWASVLLGALTTVVVAVTIWFAVDSEAWRGFENDNGPVRAISIFVLAAPIALLGRRRPRPAGMLLVVLGVVPVLLSAVTTSGGFGSLAAVSAPSLLAGIFYLVTDASRPGASRVTIAPTTAGKR